MTNEARADRALDAVGNPTRRAVLRLLSGGERSVRDLTDVLPVTQSAVSQHLRILSDAGLVTARPQGTRRLYAIDLDGLAHVRAWVDGFWDDVLASFVAHAERHEGPEVERPTAERPDTESTRSTHDC